MFLPEYISSNSSSDTSSSDDNLSDLGTSSSDLGTSSSEYDSIENDLVSIDSVDNARTPKLGTSTSICEDFSTETSVLEKNIQDFFKKSNTYIFRSTEIDGIYCSCVLYRDEKIVSVESTRVIVITNDNKVENYSLHYEYYDSISHAIEMVGTIVKTYKLYNGDLYSPEDYAYLLAEENIVPFSETQKCSVCNINTTDLTTCNHHLCFRCRENALRDGNRSCVSCNTPNVLHIYNSENISNNQKYNDINSAEKLSDTDSNDDETDNLYSLDQLIATDLTKFIKNNRESIDNAISVISTFINMYKRWFSGTQEQETSASGL
jgi:hypothetical protein